MRPCPECKRPKSIDHGALIEEHAPGCSWSPLIHAAIIVERVYPDGEVVHHANRWRMRSATEAELRTAAAEKDSP